MLCANCDNPGICYCSRCFEETCIPNLDATEGEELEKIADTLLNLQLYIVQLKGARKLRLAGNVNGACNAEAKNEKLYNTFPKWARW